LQVPNQIQSAGVVSWQLCCRSLHTPLSWVPWCQANGDTQSSFGKSIFVFVSENYFRKRKQKTVFCCFFVKKVFGKLFSKTVFENIKQCLRRLDN
jgi:hypothetical protein